MADKDVKYTATDTVGSDESGVSKDDTSDGLITCNACPVLCRIRLGRSGACDRYGNVDGILTRADPLVVTQKVLDDEGQVVPFAAASEDWDGSLVSQAPTFVTGWTVIFWPTCTAHCSTILCSCFPVRNFVPNS